MNAYIIVGAPKLRSQFAGFENISNVSQQQQLAELHETFALNKPPPGLEPHLYENYTTQVCTIDLMDS